MKTIRKPRNGGVFRKREHLGLPRRYKQRKFVEKRINKLLETSETLISVAVDTCTKIFKNFRGFFLCLERAEGSKLPSTLQFPHVDTDPETSTCLMHVNPVTT